MPDSGRSPAEVALITRLRVFQRIGAPLLSAINDWRFFGDTGGEDRGPEDEAALFAALLEATTAISEAFAEILAREAGSVPEDWMRWHLAAAISDIVTAHFRATGQPLDEDTANTVLTGLEKLLSLGPGLPPDDLNRRVGELAEQRSVAARIKGITALAPVVAAIGRFAFGRDPEALAEETTATLHDKAGAIARHLAPEACHEDDWHAFFVGILTAVCELYADCHYAEMDRLLDMEASAREAYLEAHDGTMPLDPVWRSFESRLSMLTILAERFTLPTAGAIDPPPA